MLIRNCAREHGRLPETIHSDRGGELRSVFWSKLLAHFGMTADYSPAGHSRFNSEMERMNKQVRDQWLSRRPGNTIDYLEKRGYSKGHRPEDLATIKLEELFEEIDDFRGEYNRTVVGTNSEDPQRRYDRGMERYGFSGVPVTLDDEFLLVTAYDTNHGGYKVTPAGDIVIGGLRYSHPKLAQLRPKRARTEVRIDPENPYLIYCMVGDEWVTALNANHQAFVTRNRFDRWSQSLQVGEGRKDRDEAKQDGRDRKSRLAKQFDRSYEMEEGGSPSSRAPSADKVEQVEPPRYTQLT